MHNFKGSPLIINILPILFIVLVVFSSCRKNDNFILSDSDFNISQDTLLFDTVFTSIGSATKQVKIFNNESDPIRIDVRIRGGENSVFRMNVDGFQGSVLEGIEIPPKDSIYVFMEVTVNPDNPLSVSPFVIEDDLIVSQSGVQKMMKLIAWGQNANYISGAGQIARLACDNGSISFDDDKPYVIYGILVVDSCELIIPAGARIHVHGGIVTSSNSVYNDGQIIIFPNGQLTVNGTTEEPVIFEGDRLEPGFSDVPGQWVGIRIFPQSVGNNINHADIRNSIIGVIADSASTLDIQNTIIQNTSGPSIIGAHSTIYGENLLLHSSGSHNLQLTYGGDYEFNYCTLANESSQREALYINNYKCTDLENDPLCQVAVDLYRNNVTMRNNIIYGPTSDEINLDDYTRGDQPNLLNFMFNNCIVRVDELLDPEQYPNFFNNCLYCVTVDQQDSIFLDTDIDNYSLDTNSVAKTKAVPISTIGTDILGTLRDGNTPDIGCYEFKD